MNVPLQPPRLKENTREQTRQLLISDLRTPTLDTAQIRASCLTPSALKIEITFCQTIKALMGKGEYPLLWMFQLNSHLMRMTILTLVYLHLLLT